MEKAHFLWDENKKQEEEIIKGPGYNVEEMLEKVYAALSGTSNTSAPGPDGVSYKILKIANKTYMGEQLMVQVATNLTMGSIPKEWQDSKVVFIPKPGKDHTQLKAWRPITVSNPKPNQHGETNHPCELPASNPCRPSGHCYT